VCGMTFKSHELDFLAPGPSLAGWPPSSPDGQTADTARWDSPTNEALGTIDIAGYRMSKSQKFRNNRAATNNVAFVHRRQSPHATRGGVRCLEIPGAPPSRPRRPARSRGRAAGDEL